MTDSGLRRRKIDGGGVKTSHENVKPTPKTAGYNFVIKFTLKPSEMIRKGLRVESSRCLVLHE